MLAHPRTHNVECLDFWLTLVGHKVHGPRMIMVHLLLVAPFFFRGLNSQTCTDPNPFVQGKFTIRGPCPNDTVLVLAPVGDTVHYRCEYDDTSSYFPYWQLVGLEGTPFLTSTNGMDYNLSITSSFNATINIGYTQLSIPVKEKYLNTITLDIQCGLCSLSAFTSQNILSESIISNSVKLVSVGK